jgi:phage terminase small subunit
MSTKMTLKQKAFCDYYIKLGNATEAAKQAGYSVRSADVIGVENLSKPRIKDYIGVRMKEIEDKRIATAAEVMQYLSKVMRGEETEQIVITINKGDYESEAQTIDKEISAKDKLKAAELIGKRYAIFTDKQEIDSTVVTFAGEDQLED